MKILGIETSCDETAAAIVTDGGAHGGADDPEGSPSETPRILANVVLSQLEDHAPFGGVVPEIAARAHLRHLDGLIRRAMQEAGVGFDDLDGVAATAGPGLIGGVMVGTMAAKAIAAVRGLPYLAVNHLEGHALTPRLTDGVAFPYLLLLVSGGHCQLLAVEGVGRYRRLGTTIDDAVGEAFDKAAKMLGLGYPGGPEMERAAARASDPGRFPLPVPMLGRPDCDFSFSGLKTAVRRQLELLGGSPTAADVADMAAAFHKAVGDSLVDRVGRAMALFRQEPVVEDLPPVLVVAGGVAANKALRARLDELCRLRGFRFVAPPVDLCTDNAAMIAWAGLERLRLGQSDPLDFAPRPRWPLDPGAAPAPFAGVKA